MQISPHTAQVVIQHAARDYELEKTHVGSAACEPRQPGTQARRHVGIMGTIANLLAGDS